MHLACALVPCCALLLLSCTERPKRSYPGRIARAPIEIFAGYHQIRIPLEQQPPSRSRFSKCDDTAPLVTEDGQLILTTPPDKAERLEVCVWLEFGGQLIDTHEVVIVTAVDPKNTVAGLGAMVDEYAADVAAALRSPSIPKRCDDTVAGPIEVIHAGVIAERTGKPRPKLDPPFGHANTKMLRAPSPEDAGRIRYLVEKTESRPLVALVGAKTLRAPVYRGPGMFTGGVFTGWVIVVDVETRKAMCKADFDYRSPTTVSWEVRGRQGEVNVTATGTEEEAMLHGDFESGTAGSLWEALESIAPKATWKQHWRAQL